MIPKNALAGMYVRVIGDHSLLSMAQSNLLTHLDHIGKVRTHTFLSHNGQTETGISRNDGAVRYYAWEDTLIDCRNAPALMNEETLNSFQDELEMDARFQNFKYGLEGRMNTIIRIQSFYTIMRGAEMMRYNIRRDTKVDNFDMIRIGVKLSAADSGSFNAGLACLKGELYPVKSRRFHSFF